MSQPAPPGTVERVTASSVLVLAPHPDDEVVGCGGLLAQLVADGAAVRVLFLTDGSGGRGAERVEAPEAYRDRRRAEAGRAGAALGIAGMEHLGLPDGELAAHLEEAATAIERALLAQRPQLLLAPSPLELSADHRAAFAALHRVLSPVRQGGPLDAATAQLRILAYEVNRPAFPDLLVDVSGEIARLEAAMACYESQEERHPYLTAALGLRRFRTLTLQPGVEAAEGYRGLTADDFRTRGLDALVAHLGGRLDRAEVVAGPTVSVVVRTRDRPSLLAEALASLAASRYRRLEVVLVNDGGAAPAVPGDFPFPVRRVEHAEPRGRAGAANAGIAAASGELVAFLDDDDLVEPEHFTTLVGLAARGGSQVVYSDAAVGIYELDPGHGWREVERRLPYSRDFDPDLLLVDNYIPFNTLLVDRELLTAVGALDETLAFFEDWELLIRLAQRAPFRHLAQVTCEYRHFRGGAQVFGESPRERADFLAQKARVLARHAALLTPERLARVVARLRDEQVAAAEQAASEARSRASLVRHVADLEDRFHRAHGEVESLRGEVARRDEALAERQAELERLFAEERRLGAEAELQRAEAARLRRELDERDETLRATYQEIERLNRLLREIEATRAMKLHRWLHRGRPRTSS